MCSNKTSNLGGTLLVLFVSILFDPNVVEQNIFVVVQWNVTILWSNRDLCCAVPPFEMIWAQIEKI